MILAQGVSPDDAGIPSASPEAVAEDGSSAADEMSADPVATAVMNAGARAGRPIDAFVVRKAQKSYGMGRQVEGPDVAGRNVVVLEDTSTTGGSALAAVEGVRRAGGNVVAVAVIVDRDTGSKERIEAEAGVPYLYAFGKDELGLE